MNLAIWLDRIAKTQPNHAAVLLGAEPVLTYAELRDRAARLANSFMTKHGLSADDRVGLFMANHPAYLEILFGCWWAGLIAVPINYKLHAKEAAWIIGNAGCRIVFTDHGASVDLAQEVNANTISARLIGVGAPEYTEFVSGPHETEMADRAPDDAAWLFYTSGTTGRPKGVMITHSNLAAMTACYLMDVGPIDQKNHWLYAAPFSHAAGLYGLPHVLKGAHHVVPLSKGFEPEEIATLAKKLGGVSVFAAPTMVKRMVDHAKDTGWNGDGIECIVYGGGPMYKADIEEAMAVLGDRFVQIYGQGETPMTITAMSRQLHGDRNHPRYQERLASVGRAQSLVEVKTMLPNGSDTAPGESGEVVVRGPTVMKGYWNNPEETAFTIRDGWLWTGDLGVLDEDGFLTLKDRSKDLIISGGSNIYPREIEELLLTHKRVAEAAVIGRPDREWGEVPVAFVVHAGEHAVLEQELDMLCLDNFARFKRPRQYVQLEKLPKNNYGKISKTELRKLMDDETR